MKGFLKSMAASLFVLVSLSANGSADFPRGYAYGSARPYGRHPGIDFILPIGTPIIATANGEVTFTRIRNGPQPWLGGFIVYLAHDGEDFVSVYMHLSTLDVEKGQLLKRGQLIGLSGAANNGYAHLHLGTCRTGRTCFDYSQSLDPDKFWLRGKPQCFDPGTDYSRASQMQMTLPIACGDYAKELVTRIKGTGAK